MELALEMARKYGITSVQDNSGYETTKLYREFLRQTDNLTVQRFAEWQDFEDSVVELKRQRAEFDSFKDDKNRLQTNGAVKGYVDGTLGSRTASMLAPFSDDDKNVGIMRRPPEELTKMMVERDAAGFQITLHAIGDKANRMALDGFEASEKSRDENDEKELKNKPNPKPVLQSGFGTYTAEDLRKGEIDLNRIIKGTDKSIASSHRTRSSC